MAKNLDKVMSDIVNTFELACKIGIQNSKKDIKKRIKSIHQKSIENIIYKPHTPKVYKRRWYSSNQKNESLGSFKNMVFSNEQIITNDYRISYNFDFYNVANFNSNYTCGYNFLSDLIEYGYDTRTEWYNEPRQFMLITSEKINNATDSEKELAYIIKGNITRVLRLRGY